MLENTPPTHSIPELDSKTTAKYNKDINPWKDHVQLQEHFQQLHEPLNQQGPTTNPPMHIEELAHLTNKQHQLAMILQFTWPAGLWKNPCK